MNFLYKFKERLELIRETAKQATAGLVTMAEVRDARIEICKSCDYLFEPTMQCKKCGCFIHTKTMLPHTKCPMHKWAPVDENLEE